MSTKNYKTSEFSLAEAVSTLALYMCASDGNFDDSEVKIISEHPFFAPYDVLGNKDILLDLLEAGKVNEVIKAEMPKAFEGCDMKFKEDMINAMVAIIIADGEIEDNEMAILVLSAEVLGISMEEVNRIMSEENDRKRAKLKELKSSSGGCFVATATMGDYDHPVVLDLRVFRDETLSKSLLGNLFIKFYYTFGPYPAAIIAKSSKLRELSLKYIIKPLHKLVMRK